jgi:S1-C subfamily serine protease
MKRRVEFAVGMLLLALMKQTCAFAANTSRSAHSSSAHSPQPHVPGYIGIVFHDANGHGVEIVMVDHDGPAGKAGLRPHDLILSLNGQAINSSEVLKGLIHEVTPGTGITLSVQRDGHMMTIKVQLADQREVERSVRVHLAPADSAEADPPIDEFVGGTSAQPAAPNANPQTKGSFFGSVLHSAPFTGLGLQTMEPQLAEYFGDSQGIGLLVQMVMPDSPASFSGLRAGDVLLRADTVALKTPSDWSKHLRVNQGQSMQLTVLRDKHVITVTITPEPKHHSLLEWPRVFGEPRS